MLVSKGRIKMNLARQTWKIKFWWSEMSGEEGSVHLTKTMTHAYFSDPESKDRQTNPNRITTKTTWQNRWGTNNQRKIHRLATICVFPSCKWNGPLFDHLFMKWSCGTSLTCLPSSETQVSVVLTPHRRSCFPKQTEKQKLQFIWMQTTTDRGVSSPNWYILHTAHTPKAGEHGRKGKENWRIQRTRKSAARLSSRYDKYLCPGNLKNMST